MPELNAIILAAGKSRRMGLPNKLLLDWHGAPMIRHVAKVYLKAVGQHVIIVTGDQRDAVEGALAGLPLRFQHNQAHEEGQQSSVVAGLQAVTATGSTFIGLGDQPLLTAQDLVGVLAARKSKDKIAIPHNGTQRGNPILVPAALRARLLEEGKQPGCRRFTRENPDLVEELHMTAPGFFTDVDTPEAYETQRRGAAHGIATF